MISTALILVVALTTPLVKARTFTVTNTCPFTVWPALFTDLNVAQDIPDQPTGWEALPGTSVIFPVPDNWVSGRIWGRSDCDFEKDPSDAGSCVTGGCNGGLLCDPHTGIGATPASLAEWTLGTNGSPVYYDVSLVDGLECPELRRRQEECRYQIRRTPEFLILAFPNAVPSSCVVASCDTTVINTGSETSSFIVMINSQNASALNHSAASKVT